jgi:hypothetical protein
MLTVERCTKGNSSSIVESHLFGNRTISLLRRRSGRSGKQVSIKNKCIIQWALLNGITDNRINRLIGSNLSMMTLSYLTYVEADSLIIISRIL